MAGALIKNTKKTYTPGSPGVPGTPGSPYIPAKPAHTEWQTVRYSYSGQPEYSYRWTDKQGQVRTSSNLSEIAEGATGVSSIIKSPLDILREIAGGRPITAIAAHYIETRGLVTVSPYATPQVMILSWTAPWVEVMEQVLVPGAPAVPAVAPTPGVPATAATTSSDFNIGWNSGARSVEAIAGDCAYTFSVDPSSVGVVTGLNDADNDPGYGEIDFGFYLRSGIAQVYENGISKSAAFAFGAGDTFVIRRQGLVVTYEHNSEVIHTSAKTSIGVVFADVSMYMGGDTITAASFGALAPSAHGAGKFLPLAGNGGDASASGAGKFLPLKGSGYGPPPAGYVTPPEGEPHPEPLPPEEGGDGGYVPPSAYGVGYFLPLTGLGGDDPTYAAGAGVFAPLTGSGFIGSLAPEYAIGTGVFSYLTGAGDGLTGELGAGDGSFLPLTGKSADYDLWEGAGAFEPLTGFGGSVNEWSWSASADLVMPGPFIVEARATRHPLNTLEARMPRFTLEAFGGAQLRAAMPMPTLQATGTGVVIGRINATMPMPTLEASGITGSVGRIDATLRGGFTLEAYGGAVIEAILQDGFTLQASGTTGAVGRLTATMPMFELEAHASADQVGRIDATMPMIRPVASAVLDVLMPMFRLVASGHAVVAVDYEAYTMNLVGPVDLDLRSPHSPSGREITRYTNFPFDQIVRHGDKYYGVSSTGLYLLGGDTDDGAPIPWAFRTATTDFGTIQRKTVVSAYLGGKVMPTATATIFAGEAGEINYTYPVPPSATNQNYRVRFGRGLKTRYFALEMADARGGDVRADSIDFEINTMTRAL